MGRCKSLLLFGRIPLFRTFLFYTFPIFICNQSAECIVFAYLQVYTFKFIILFQETWYLKPYLDEIEEEKKTRSNTSGLLPGFQLKKHH